MKWILLMLTTCSALGQFGFNSPAFVGAANVPAAAGGGGGGPVGVVASFTTNRLSTINHGGTVDGGAGANRGLILFVSGYDGGTLTNATWGGAALTEVTRTNYYDGNGTAAAWYLHNPATGSQAYSNKFSASIGAFEIAMLFVTNAHQSAATGNTFMAEYDSDTSGQTNSISCAADDLIVDSWTRFAAAFVGVRATGQTRATTRTGNDTGCDTSWAVATTTSQSMGWTNSAVDHITHIIVQVKPP